MTKNTIQKSETSLNPIKLMIATCKYWRTYFWRITWLTAIVAIPGSMIRVVQFDSVNDASIVASLAGLYLSVALTWIFFKEADLKKFKFPSLYVRSSVRFLPFLLTSIFFVCISMPSLIGIMIIILSISAQIPLAFAIVGLIISLASIYLIVRFSLATTLVVPHEISAFNAMRLSWQVTKGNIIRISLAWASIVFGIVILSGLLLSGFEFIPLFAENLYAQVVLNGLLLTFLLPLFIGYGVQMVQRLEYE